MGELHPAHAMADTDYWLVDLVLELVDQGKQVARMVVPVGWEMLDALSAV